MSTEYNTQKTFIETGNEVQLTILDELEITCCCGMYNILLKAETEILFGRNRKVQEGEMCKPQEGPLDKVAPSTGGR